VIEIVEELSRYLLRRHIDQTLAYLRNLAACRCVCSVVQHALVVGVVKPDFC
jgi:hypothetical protein